MILKQDVTINYSIDIYGSSDSGYERYRII